MSPAYFRTHLFPVKSEIFGEWFAVILPLSWLVVFDFAHWLKKNSVNLINWFRNILSDFFWNIRTCPHFSVSFQTAEEAEWGQSHQAARGSVWCAGEVGWRVSVAVELAVNPSHAERLSIYRRPQSLCSTFISLFSHSGGCCFPSFGPSLVWCSSTSALPLHVLFLNALPVLFLSYFPTNVHTVCPVNVNTPLLQIIFFFYVLYLQFQRTKEKIVADVYLFFM